MLHGHGDFGQVPVSETDTWVLVRHLKSVPEEYPLFFFEKIWVHCGHGRDTPELSSPRHYKTSKKEKGTKKEQDLDQCLSLSLSSLIWSVRCAFSATTKPPPATPKLLFSPFAISLSDLICAVCLLGVTTPEPPPASSDPKPPLSLCHFSLYRFLVLCLLVFQLFFFF